MYANPIHPGHIECLRLSKELCDELWVIINNDKQAELKRGVPSFQDEHYRKEVVGAIKYVDHVFISTDTGDTIRFDSLRPEHQEPYAINSMVQTPSGVILRALQNGMIGVNNPRYYQVPKIGSNNSSTEVRLITGPRKE